MISLSSITIYTTTVVGPIGAQKLVYLIDDKLLSSKCQYWTKPYNEQPDQFKTYAWHAISTLQKPGHLIIQSVYQLAKSCLPIVQDKTIRNWVSNVLIPILEEFEYRWFVQHICLKVGPEIVITTVFPSYSLITNSLILKILRTVAGAGFFALAHTDQWGLGEIQKPMGLYCHFASGLVYSGLYEFTGHLNYNILGHIIHNTAIDLFDL